MSIDLPLPLSRYFALANGESAVRAEQCFAADATVHDEQHDHYGIPAISRWMEQARAAYQHQLQPLQHAQRDGRHIVTSRVTGNFAGSPLLLAHAFVLADGRITALEIK